MENPLIIQGGMGVGVSSWRLARAVSSCGQLGVVSGTFIDSVMARRLQDGDEDGSVRRALAQFPFPHVSRRIIDRYFIAGGRAKDAPYRPVPMHGVAPDGPEVELTVAANFVEVFLAKEGHNGPVGINYLMKIDLPTLPSLYGAMLAGVDFVLMGAGIPKAIPAILDDLSLGKKACLKLDVKGADSEDSFSLDFDPAAFGANAPQRLARPRFLAIVSSATLAQSLARKSSGRVDGFVVEHHSAGGHNAPPRGGLVVDENGEPLYGDRDQCSPEDFQKIGLPFWWAGSCAAPERLQEALAAGAAGIQVGTAFAYADESGIREDIKRAMIESVLAGTARVFTDPVASASGYPFKIVELAGSLSEADVYAARPRVCDLGYLRTAYKAGDGTIAFRCPAEPVETYTGKGGSPGETVGRKCLCNGLMATIGLAQVQKGGYVEPPLVTAGKELEAIARVIPPGCRSYRAVDVLRYLLSGTAGDAAWRPLASQTPSLTRDNAGAPLMA